MDLLGRYTTNRSPRNGCCRQICIYWCYCKWNYAASCNTQWPYGTAQDPSSIIWVNLNTRLALHTRLEPSCWNTTFFSLSKLDMGCIARFWYYMGYKHSSSNNVINSLCRIHTYPQWNLVRRYLDLNITIYYWIHSFLLKV